MLKCCKTHSAAIGLGRYIIRAVELNCGMVPCYLSERNAWTQWAEHTLINGASEKGDQKCDTLLTPYYLLVKYVLLLHNPA